MELSQIDTTQLLQELKDRYTKAVNDVKALAQIMGKTVISPTVIEPTAMHVRRKRGPYRKKVNNKTLSERALECLEKHQKPLSAVEIANCVGGSELPKEDKDRRKSFYAGINAIMFILFNNGSVDKKLKNGVYVYNKKLQS